MQIFSRYPQGESRDHLEKLILVVEGLNAGSISLEGGIDQFLNLYELGYTRALVCALALNLKNEKSHLRIQTNIDAYIEVLKNYLCQRKVVESALIYSEYVGIINRYKEQSIGDADLAIKPQFLNKQIIYQPVASGFFSVIENIVNAKIFCDVHRSRFHVKLSGGWWKYHDPFNDMVDCFDYQIPAFHPIETKSYSQAEMRKWFFSLSVDQYPEYNRRKIIIYRKIYNSLKNYLEKNHIQWNMHLKDTSAGVYLRKGDKILLEDVNIPDENLIRYLSTKLQRYDSVYISSDDVLWAKEQFSKIHPAIMFDDSTTDGYFFGKESATDHIDIVKKYLRLSSTNVLIGDVGSNLVNAIAYNRIFDGLPSIDTDDFFPTAEIPLI
jgi:hypothetical protein